MLKTRTIMTYSIAVALIACGSGNKKSSDQDNNQQNTPPSEDSSEDDGQPGNHSEKPVDDSSPGESKTEYTLSDFTLVDQIGELQIFENKKQSSNKKSVKFVVLPTFELKGGQFTPAIDIKKYTSGGDLRGIRLYYKFNWGAGIEDAKAFNEKYGTDRTNMIYEGAIGSDASFELLIDGVSVDSVTFDKFSSVNDRTLSFKTADSGILPTDKLFESESTVIAVKWNYRAQESGVTYNFSSDPVQLHVENIKRTLITE